MSEYYRLKCGLSKTKIYRAAKEFLPGGPHGVPLMIDCYFKSIKGVYWLSWFGPEFKVETVFRHWAHNRIGFRLTYLSYDEESGSWKESSSHIIVVPKDYLLENCFLKEVVA